MFHGCFKFKGVSRLFQGSAKRVSRVIESCFKGVSMDFEECFIGVGRVFISCHLRSLLVVSEEFQRCLNVFNVISCMFQGRSHP